MQYLYMGTYPVTIKRKNSGENGEVNVQELTYVTYMSQIFLINLYFSNNIIYRFDTSSQQKRT